MGFVLIWIESLAVSLLIMAFVFALTGRIHRRWLRLIIWIPIATFIFLIYLALTILTGALKFGHLPDFMWFYFTLSLMLTYAAGVICLSIAGQRKASGESSVIASATWPLGKLAIASGVAAALHLMTFWNMDLEARQQLASLRAEAGALASSVAPPRIPDSDNAALLYEQAGQALSSALNINYSDNFQSKNEEWNIWADSMNKPDFNPQDPALVRFLQQQDGTIALILKATKKPGCYFEHDYNRPSIAMLLPEFRPLRDVAKLMALHARWKAATGDYQTAMEDVNAVFIMAEHVSNEPILIAGLVSAAIDSLAYESLQNILASHQLGQADLDMLKLNSSFSHEKLMQRSLLYEEALRLSIFYDIDKYGFSQILYGKGPDIRGSSFVFRIFLLNDEIQANKWYSDQANQYAAQPYYKTKDQWEKLLSFSEYAPNSIFVRSLFPALNRYVESMTRADARRDNVRLALAMCHYRAKNGKYPDKLEEMVPDYMAFVPVDLFDGKPLHLKQTADKLVIYSVGPDGIDDGGAPYDKQSHKGDVTFELPQAK
ncbi:MAG TPA: hypothetical protein VIH42_05555 [Thermoguttaceae bacterium]